MDENLKTAIQTALINIGNTEEGKAVIAIYSHNGYEPAQSSDYDKEREAQKLIQELNAITNQKQANKGVAVSAE